VVALLISACGSSHNRLTIDVSGVDIPPVKIHRYDLDLFRANPANLRQDLEKLKPGFRFFLDTDLRDSSKLGQMKSYLESPRNLEFHTAVSDRFKDLTTLENELTNAFRHLKFYYPGIKVPRVYTYISGGDYDYPVQFADSVLLIGLDNFLGKDFKAYAIDGLPLYRIARMTPDYIIPQVVKVLESVIIPPYPGNNVLEQMIETGKQIYFIQAMVPGTDLKLILGYSDAQYNWIVKNEAHVWSSIIENQLLYSTDGRVIRSFFADGPFSTDFSAEAPARMGEYIGFQIVKKFMENQPAVMLPALMEDKDYQKILTGSKYKPRK
jgi:hypothetical protein